ncbi:MAG: DUF2147 domain-containing protein [Caulobacteraceae bacterium]
MMKMFAIGAAALAVASLASAASAASPADGLWRAESGGGVIELHECGDALCGRLADSTGLRLNPLIKDDSNPKPELRDRLIHGMDILHGFHGGPTEWTNGRIYNPNSGKTYTGSLKLLDPDHIKLSGCLVFPLCKSQVWRRIPE